MSIASEFRKFIARGNVVDLAVGVVIGGAFGKIVTSFVDDLVMPPIGVATGGVDFSNLKVVLRAADPVHKVAEASIHYGAFINTIIQFLIIAAAIFLMVKVIHTIRRQKAAEPEPAAPTTTEALLAQIRDLLANRPAACRAWSRSRSVGFPRPRRCARRWTAEPTAWASCCSTRARAV